ncbi:hypothetical protein B0O40_0021 [Ruminococcaceae bacterium R-25]|nr:hypothetical protein B0O40_0021 [Ruminococcaceae bacterium R-25]SUQ10670.1 hypothetical protein SAMN06297423_0021 [Oscillospiraceae bacterium]
MGAISDNKDKNKFSPDFPAFGADFGNAKSTSNGSNDFEYGDDSVAGEYDVKESSVFKYGAVATSEAIGAYYGNESQKETPKETQSETRIDRYAKDMVSEEDNIYGYETVPETEDTLPAAEAEVHSREIISEEEPESQSEVYDEDPFADIGTDYHAEPESESEQEPEYAPEQEAEPEVGQEPVEKYESQAYEPDLDDELFENPHENKTREDPILVSYEKTLIEDPAIVNMNLAHMHRESYSKVKMSSWSAAICTVAFFGIASVCGFAFYFDQRKNNSKGVSNVPPTTMAEVTTAAEESSEAAATLTPTPEPTATPTPEPTETPAPTPTTVPQKTQVYWPVAKKTTATPTPVATNENSSENGGSSEGGTGTSEGNDDVSNEGGNNKDNEGGNVKPDAGNGSENGGNGQENSGSGTVDNNNSSQSDSSTSSSNSSEGNNGSNGQQDGADSN